MLKNKLLLICTLILSGSHQLIGQDKRTLSMTLSGAYLREDFRWSIAGNANGNSPNILSELKWSDLTAPLAKLDIEYNVSNILVLKTNYSYATILSGKVNDRDYVEDDRKANVYDGNFASNKGSISSLELSLGAKLLKKKTIPLTPYLGYTTSTQHLFLLGNDASSQNLKSSYNTKWNGLVFGMQSTIKAGKMLTIMPELGYQQLKYKSEADWNLIENFKHPISFEQHANGFKLQFQVTINYQLNKSISISFYNQYNYWETGKGVDRLYLKDGTTSITRFNGAYRTGIYTGLGLKYMLRW